MQIINFILDNAEAAGIIGGYVAITIIGFSIITYFTEGKINTARIKSFRKFHPLFGALLGVIPGCGATIVCTTMYKNNKLTFGGLLAAFITTLGESSYVLLGSSSEDSTSANLEVFLIVNLIGIFVGVIVGYLVDLLKIKFTLDTNSTKNHKHITSLNQHNNKFFTFSNYFLLVLTTLLIPSSIAAIFGK